MFESLNKPKAYLLLSNVLLAFFLILFSNLKLLPLRAGDLLFFVFLFLALALYRPGWAFLLFIGTMPLENINLAPSQLGIAIRPYQFFGALLILAIAIRALTKRLDFKITKPTWLDGLVLLIVLGGFLSASAVAVETQNFASVHLAIIIGTFAALYYLVRNYIQNTEDLKRIIPFFLSSSVVVILYGVWQNWRLLHNLSNFEAMPGRPNATFTEADWLGMFLVLLLSVIFVLIYKCGFVGVIRELPEDENNVGSQAVHEPPLRRGALYLLLILTFILLILTVSRSAWLGALIVYIICALIIFTDFHFKNFKWREVSWFKVSVVSCLAVAILMTYLFHLTNFQLFNRAASTGTGLQKITISCDPSCLDARSCVSTSTIIKDVSELEKYGCRFINLEDIESEKSQGKFVTEIYRNDPNVKTRSEIYQKSWQQIKNHPILGIGWGSIGQVLGRDDRGVILNSSNIFLETWLGAGILGFLALVILLGYVLLSAIKNYFRETDYLQKIVNLFIIISWFAVVIPNLFNAGIFLGIFWVWLAAIQIHE